MKSNDQWKTLKTETNTKQITTPNSITHNNETISSPLKIAEIANNFYINKINSIRQNFNNNNCDPITILNKLIPRKINIFKLPYITNNETMQIIKKIKPSNPKGHDQINSRIIKTIKENIAPQSTYQFNSIIRTSNMRDIFKISKILPIGKPNKRTNNIESFRPINNLVLIEKTI